MKNPLAAQLLQIAAAACGGLIFHLLGVPAAWLSGAVIGTVVWGALGFGARLSRPIVEAAMVISGVVMGASITPEAMAAIGTYPLSILLLCIAVPAITAASALFLMKVYGWNRDDAVLASIPGALTAVLAVAVSRNAGVARIAVVQSFRLLVLIAVLPFVVSLSTGGEGSVGVGQGMQIATPAAFVAMVAAGLAVGLLFERLRVAAPLLLGATVGSAVLHVTDFTPGAVPPAIATLGFVVIGVFIGERFSTLDRTALRSLAPAAIGSFAVGMAIAIVFALLAVVLVDIRLGEAMVAFAPGGVEAMIILALVLGLDPLYVGVHHVVRFLGIGLALPILFRGSGKAASTDDLRKGKH
ncbi:MAG TPA: AbrB family transcriptional regulator [Saliniramus sp.]|nr:AbrB family transcriptional regulator [Saliniramus sp.]